MAFISIADLENFIVEELASLAQTRKIVPYANPSTYDLTNIPANGMGYLYVNIASISTPDMPNNRNFGPIITKPNVTIRLTLVQRGNYSHKHCYPTIESIISLLHGLEHNSNILLFDNFSYAKQDNEDKCWQYDIIFKYSFDFVGESACC